MASTVLTYDPKSVQLIVGGAIIGGFAADEFIDVEFDVDAYTKYVGCGGEVARIKSTNRAGKITVRLMQSSPSNDELSLLAELDAFANSGAVPFLLREKNGSTLFSAVFCWVRKLPKTSWRKEVEMREWTLDTSGMIAFVGGLSS